MEKITTQVTASTKLADIVSKQALAEYPFVARGLPIVKRIAHSKILANRELETVADLARFEISKHRDLCQYAPEENLREIYAILLTVYSKDLLEGLTFATLRYTRANDLLFVSNLGMGLLCKDLLYANNPAKRDTYKPTMTEIREAKEALKALDVLDRELIELRYGINDSVPRTARELMLLYRFDNEKLSEGDVQLLIDDCLAILRQSMSTKGEVLPTPVVASDPNPALERKIKEEQNFNDSLSKNNSRLTTENRTLTAENQTLKAEIQTLKAKNQALTAENAKAKAANEQLRTDKEALEEKISAQTQLENEVKRLKMLNESLAKRSGALAESLKVESKKLDDAKATIKSLGTLLSRSSVELLKQAVPTRYQIYGITLGYKPAPNPFTPTVTLPLDSLKLSKKAEMLLRENGRTTPDEIVDFIRSCGWSLMESTKYRSLIVEIMAAIRYNPTIDNRSLEEINLNMRAYNCMNRAGLKTAEDIKKAALSGGLFDVRNCGRHTRCEILEKIGLA